MVDRYGTSRAFRQAIEARLMAQSKATGVDLGRLRRQVSFERLLARLAGGPAGTTSWVLKGGFALELRLGNISRTTRDLDLATLEGEFDGQRMWSHLRAALEEDVDGDYFTFAVAAPRPLAADMAGRPGWRFSVDVRLAGKSFAMVRITVFRVRDTHPMPTQLPEPPSAWRDDYLGLIEELDIGARTIEDAMAVVRPIWRFCVENVNDPA